MPLVQLKGATAYERLHQVNTHWHVSAILVGVSCYFWYQWQTEPYREEYGKTQQFASEWRTSQQSADTHKTSDVLEQDVDGGERTAVATEHATEMTETPVAHVTPGEIAVSQTPEAVAVSPHGVGAYPKIPESWPQDVTFFPAKTIEHELMLRVEIELTNQGIDVMGSSMENGRVYPNVAGRVYVRWTEDPDFGRYISEVGGHPETAMQFEMMLETFEEQQDRNFTRTDAPSEAFFHLFLYIFV